MVYRIALASMILALSMALSAASGQARRVALIIGINDYAEVPKLEKAVGDASAMSSALEQLGFEVTRVLDADRRALNIAISEFTAKLTADDIAFVHFSGHGVEIDGENFLLPADIPKPKAGHEGAVKYEAIGLQRLVAQIAASGVRTRLFVIDACRNNPFEQAGVRAVGATRGLAYVAAPAGTFMMYSAGYGQMALDKLNPEDDAPTSVYTRVLTQKLLTPGKSVADIAQEVRSDVQKLAKTAGHDQRPAYYDELSANLVLNPAAPSTGGNAASDPTTGEPKVSDSQIELTFWNSVKDGDSPEMFELYLERYPQGSFASLARLKVDQLRNANSSGPVEEKPSADEPEPSQTASRNSQDQATAEAERKLTRDVQVQLNRLGCDVGAPDGIWGRRSTAALRQFSRHGKTSLPSYQPSARVLSILTGKSGRICPCPNGQSWRDGQCRVIAAPAAPAPAKTVVSEPVRAKEKIYTNPRIGGVPVDICTSPFKQCTGEAAHAWCRSKGYGRAQIWTQVVYPKTRHINGGDCVTGSFLLCAGYDKIACSG